MNLFLAFTGEGSSDTRFMTVLTERIVEKFLLDREITAELSWTIMPKKPGSSHSNILKASKEAKDQNILFIHRDADNNNWERAYQNHFETAFQEITNDKDGLYNQNLIAIIPVKETEAWMLCNKQILKNNIETALSNSDLELTYQLSRIEQVNDPKGKIQRAIEIHNQALTKKQRRYSIKIGDLYDLIGNEVPLSDLEYLDSFVRFKNRLEEVLNSMVNP